MLMIIPLGLHWDMVGHDAWVIPAAGSMRDLVTSQGITLSMTGSSRAANPALEPALRNSKNCGARKQSNLLSDAQLGVVLQ